MKFGTTAILPGLSIIHPSYINHNPSTPDPIPGPEGLKPIILAMRNGIPDLFYEIKETIITADDVVARVQVTGTHLGTSLVFHRRESASIFSKST